jgi:carbamoyltransferase
MKILGISAFYHDSAAALIENGEIIAAAQEERFTRKKHDSSFPKNAVKFVLEYSGTSIEELDAIVFYDKPLLKFERLMETYYTFAPKGALQFANAIPVWVKEKLLLKEVIKSEIKSIENVKKFPKLLFSEHHLSHAASAFYPSPFEEAAILTIDGVGEWATASIAYGKGNKIKILKELHFPHSVGLLYSAFTYYLGFRVNSGEYKLMGLAPYGNPNSERVSEFIKLIKENLIRIYDDGSVWLNQEFFDYSTGLKMVNEEKWEKLFGFKRRMPESEIEQIHADLALAIQKVLEEIVIKMAKHAKELTGAKYLCMAGGVALNCVANTKLLETGIFEDIWVQPAAGDAGGALGAALAVYHLYFNKPREVVKPDAMKGSYLGPEYCDLEIEKVLKKYKVKFRKFKDFDKLAFTVASAISEGKVVGWFQGRMEWGPRALGNRSILGDARNPEMQKRLNLKIKFRESFRPFAPSVLYEDLNEYFEFDRPAPYMLFIAYVKKERRRNLPPNYHELPIREKLYYVRSDIPAVTHLDFSARIQTVHKETNPKYHKLLKKFKELTGYSVVVNTSFNVRGEPIVCSPEDAFKCFARTDMDLLVLGNYLIDKQEQKHLEEIKINLNEEFPLD